MLYDDCGSMSFRIRQDFSTISHFPCYSRNEPAYTYFISSSEDACTMVMECPISTSKEENKAYYGVSQVVYVKYGKFLGQDSEFNFYEGARKESGVPEEFCERAMANAHLIRRHHPHP